MNWGGVGGGGWGMGAVVLRNCRGLLSYLDFYHLDLHNVPILNMIHFTNEEIISNISSLN